MRINLRSVFVDDQDKALRFYTEVLGFQKKTEIPMGAHRWLTVVSPEEPGGPELVLEPDEHPAVKPSRRRSRATESLSRHSPSTTCIRSTSDCRRSACGSRRSRHPWVP